MTERIAALAARQHGNVTRAQLLALGLDQNAIAYRVRTGWLIRVYAGVYAVGHAPTSPVARAAAAVLACGSASALSHDSAVSLWGWRSDWRFPLEVTTRWDRRRGGIRVHRSSTLTPTDLTTQLEIRVTSPARTVLDVAPRLKTRRAVSRLVNDAQDQGHLKLRALAELLERRPRDPGAPLLRAFVDTTAGPTRSEFEDAFVAFTEAYGLPRPQMNVLLAGHLVDALFIDEGVVVELDGWGYHWTRESFESDRERDAQLLDRLGILTVRITWERLTTQPAAEAARLHRILERRRRRRAA